MQCYFFSASLALKLEARSRVPATATAGVRGDKTKFKAQVRILSVIFFLNFGILVPLCERLANPE